MLKKSIIGLLLLAIAMPAFAGGDVEKKVPAWDWPTVFKWVTVCEGIKCEMNVGYYIKIKQCNEKKIWLDQKSASKYEGSVQIEMMSNFEAELGAQLHPTPAGTAMSTGDTTWKAWMGEGDHYLSPSTSYQKKWVWAQVNKLSIVKGNPTTKVHVANVHILVRPVATP